jgi:two-component system sensor histidine kinase and response regulator WspE
MSMLELFRIETENQCVALTEGLLAIERNPQDGDRLAALMRAAHSLKGAARILGLTDPARVAHAMEHGFVAAQKGALRLQQQQVDILLKGVDYLQRVAHLSESELMTWDQSRQAESSTLVHSLEQLTSVEKLAQEPPVDSGSDASKPANPSHALASTPAAVSGEVPIPSNSVEPTRHLRVKTEHWNRVLALAGDTLVAAKHLRPMVEELQRLKKRQGLVVKLLEELHVDWKARASGDFSGEQLKTAHLRALENVKQTSKTVEALEAYCHRSTMLAHRLYHEAHSSRMRPFADGVGGFPRMIRDLARTLGKEIRLEIQGETTPVDRDILDQLEAPLIHLLRNAADHGIEQIEERVLACKPREGLIRMEARHQSGQLWITVEDDGRGINWPRLRQAIVERHLASQETADHLDEKELIDFLFLPGFSLQSAVTEISGRGVGLDVVQAMLRSVRGSLRASSLSGKGTKFILQVPQTLSLTRALLVQIAGELYAFPLGQVEHVLQLDATQIQYTEGRPHFAWNDHSIGLIQASQVLDLPSSEPDIERWPVLILNAGSGLHYGILVDQLLGEQELVVQPLDPRLGKVKNISAGSITENGSPVLIVDLEDWLRSLEALVSRGRLDPLRNHAMRDTGPKRKRVLIVDDSLTVRELERKIVEMKGYEVQVAVDGMDGWNSVRTSEFDLVITDVDMPRLDGIELVRLIKQHPELGKTPVMIVSYKDREEDRQRGLQAGADYYLTKGAFQEEALLEAVADLIGGPEADNKCP